MCNFKLIECFVLFYKDFFFQIDFDGTRKFYEIRNYYDLTMAILNIRIWLIKVYNKLTEGSITAFCDNISAFNINVDYHGIILCLLGYNACMASLQCHNSRFMISEL